MKAQIEKCYILQQDYDTGRLSANHVTCAPLCTCVYIKSAFSPSHLNELLFQLPFTFVDVLLILPANRRAALSGNVIRASLRVLI